MDWKIILEIITIPSNTSIMYSLFQEQLILFSFFENHLKQGIKVDLKAQTNFYKVKDILKGVRIMTSLKLILFSSKQLICSVYKFVNKDSGRDLPSLYPQTNGLKTTYSLLMGLFPAQTHHFPVTAEKTGKELFLTKPPLCSPLTLVCRVQSSTTSYLVYTQLVAVPITFYSNFTCFPRSSQAP